MALFGNEAKRQAKKLTAADWMLWSYGVRVQSNEAAVAVASAVQGGGTVQEVARDLHRSCWSGAANEATSYYPQADVQRLFRDPDLEASASKGIVDCQYNRTLKPLFTDDVVAALEEDVRGYRQREAEQEIRKLQMHHASLTANPAPLLDEIEERREVGRRLAELGGSPDPELVEELKRQRGIEHTPFDE